MFLVSYKQMVLGYWSTGWKQEIHLEEALHILQDVNSTVAEVILLRHTWAGALHHVLPETPLSPLPHLPLHLQVPKTNTPTVSVNSTKTDQLTIYCLFHNIFFYMNMTKQISSSHNSTPSDKNKLSDSSPIFLHICSCVSARLCRNSLSESFHYSRPGRTAQRVHDENTRPGETKKSHHGFSMVRWANQN